MEWLLFIVGIMADGTPRESALETFTEARACMARAREVNAMPNGPTVAWANAGCLQIPARDTVNPGVPDPAKGTRL